MSTTLTLGAPSRVTLTGTAGLATDVTVPVGSRFLRVESWSDDTGGTVKLAPAAVGDGASIGTTILRVAVDDPTWLPVPAQPGGALTSAWTMSVAGATNSQIVVLTAVSGG